MNNICETEGYLASLKVVRKKQHAQVVGQSYVVVKTLTEGYPRCIITSETTTKSWQKWKGFRIRRPLRRWHACLPLKVKQMRAENSELSPSIVINHCSSWSWRLHLLAYSGQLLTLESDGSQDLAIAGYLECQSRRRSSENLSNHIGYHRVVV